MPTYEIKHAVHHDINNEHISDEQRDLIQKIREKLDEICCFLYKDKKAQLKKICLLDNDKILVAFVYEAPDWILQQFKHCTLDEMEIVPGRKSVWADPIPIAHQSITEVE